MALSNMEVVKKMREFAQKKNISTTGIALFTIQKNYSTEFSALVIDFDNAILLDHYPIQSLNSYKEMDIGGGTLKIAYAAGLAHVQANVDINNNSIVYEKPFCCSQIKPYRERNISAEHIFKGFLSASGTFNEIVFEVKCQVDNGPLLCTDYFTLKGNRIEQVYGKYTNKKHSFKNYKCAVHSLFYGVDLYTVSAGSNFHHMRLNPFAKLNMAVMEEFFLQANL